MTKTMTNYFLDSLVPQTSLRGIDSGRDFSKARNNENLLPWQVTGLADGEGGFNCFIDGCRSMAATFAIMAPVKA